MNRRQFCLKSVASLAVAAMATEIACAEEAPPDASEEVLQIWSVLIPALQPLPGRGYMVALQTAIPDGFPYAETGAPKRPIEAMGDLRRHAYSTIVPEEFRPSFSQALVEANTLHTKTALIGHRLQLPKRYRLLSAEELKFYFALTPAAEPAGWKPDKGIARRYKGWKVLSSVSLPYFDQDHQFAMVWASTNRGCAQISWNFFTRTPRGWQALNWKTLGIEQCA